METLTEAFIVPGIGGEVPTEAIENIREEEDEEDEEGEDDSIRARSERAYRQHLREAESHVNAHDYTELYNMETLGTGQFANRKIDNGRVRVWLSRMTIEDGAPFNHPIEIEVYNPVEGRWMQYADYPSNINEQGYHNVVRYMQEEEDY